MSSFFLLSLKTQKDTLSEWWCVFFQSSFHGLNLKSLVPPFLPSTFLRLLLASVSLTWILCPFFLPWANYLPSQFVLCLPLKEQPALSPLPMQYKIFIMTPHSMKKQILYSLKNIPFPHHPTKNLKEKQCQLCSRFLIHTGFFFTWSKAIEVIFGTLVAFIAFKARWTFFFFFFFQMPLFLGFLKYPLMFKLQACKMFFFSFLL